MIVEVLLEVNHSNQEVAVFKNPDQKREELNGKNGRTPCPHCKGTGTYGVGGRGSATSSPCSKCKGTGHL